MNLQPYTVEGYNNLDAEIEILRKDSNISREDSLELIRANSKMQEDSF